MTVKYICFLIADNGQTPRSACHSLGHSRKECLILSSWALIAVLVWNSGERQAHKSVGHSPSTPYSSSSKQRMNPALYHHKASLRRSSEYLANDARYLYLRCASGGACIWRLWTQWGSVYAQSLVCIFLDSGLLVTAAITLEASLLFTWVSLNFFTFSYSLDNY